MRGSLQTRARQLIFCGIWIFSTLYLQGQVKFKVELSPDGITYRVSMLPEVTWNPPLNITSTAQVTLKVPTGGFGVTSLASQQPGTFWSQNARYNQPSEAPAYDYISFGLTSLGTTGFSYQAGVEVPLFTFINNGVCTGGVEIMPNGDPFLPPNSLNANVNNQITTLGTGLGSNGFGGIYDASSANCLAATTCSVSFELDMLADGTYQVSLLPDTTWLPPANTTDSLQVTLVAPAGSFVLGGLQSLVNGANFLAGTSFPAPAENPDFDYFTIRLQATTTGIAFTQNSKTPLFTFKNLGSCSGDTLSLPDFQNDPFLDVTPAARMRIKTNGSVSGIYACVSGGGQPMQPVISSVSSISSSDCNAPNGLITISTSSAAALQFSLDGGASWQQDNVFMNLSDGSYQAAARFSNGTCPVLFAQNPIVLTAPESPEIQSISKTNPTGCGSDDGSIVVFASYSPSGTGGGGVTLEYSITGGAFWQTSNIFGGLTAGSYSVKVRTSDGACTVDGGVQTLNSAGATPTVFAANATPPSTCAGNNGSLVISASGAGSLQFSINNGFTWSSSNVFTGLKNGNYNVLVRSQPGGCVGIFAGNPVVLQTPGCGGCLIEYELELLPDGRYQVSMTPDTTWLFPQSITGTAQVTIVVPTGGFHVVNLTNLQPGVEFLDNVRVNAPAENLGYDYISFGLQTLGTAGIPYQKGVKVPLFTFENGGICTGQNVFLMDDNTDPFSPPNSASSNAGQQLTTVGSGSDAFVCIKQPGFVPCSPEPQNHLEAVDDAYSGFANSLLAGNILTNDLNPNQNTLTVNTLPVVAPAHGTLSLNSNGTFIFHPDQNFTGTDVFQYLVCDDGTPAICEMATVTLTILPPFSAVDDHFSTFQNTPVSGQVLPNDPNSYGSLPIVSLVAGASPQHGSVTILPDGNFTYTPAPGFTGTDSFQYSVCEANPAWCDTATVFITVQLAPDAVVAVDDFYQTTENQPVNGDVLGNDANPNGNPLTVSLLLGGSPVHGSLNLSPNGNFTYTPLPGFTGTDVFAYVVCENASAPCDTASVSIVVSGLPQVTAENDFFLTSPGSPVFADVTANDQIPGGTTFQVSEVSGGDPAHGQLILGSNGTFIYQPDPGFAGTDVFQYELCPTPSGTCDTATVTIYVQPADDLAAVDDDFFTEKDEPVSGNVLANDQNPDGSDLTVSLLPGSQPAHGDLILNPDGTFTYLPDPGFTGTDEFQYLVCEILTNACDTATVTLQVNPELEAVNDEFLLAIGSLCGGDVLLNDTIPCPGGSPLGGGGGCSAAAFAQIIPGTGPNHGTVSMQPNGAFNYLPNPGFSGVDSFQYVICLQNAPAICDTATVKLTVFQGVPPIPQTDCATTQVCPGENIVLNVAASFSGTNLSYRWKNGNGETVSTSSGLVLAADSPLAVPPFSAQVQVNGLWSEASVPCYVQVGVAPVAQIQNPSAVCPGGSLQLVGSGSPSGGGSSNNQSGFQYEWRQVGQPAILGTQSVLQLSNITQSTTYELTVTNAACGVSTSTTTTVEVLPGVSIQNLTGGGTYCHGSAVTLNGNGSPSGGAGGGTVSYTWTGPNNFYFTQTAPPQGPFPLNFATLIPENEGSYTLTVSTLAGCVSTPLSTIIDYVPQPATPELTLSDDFACQGDQLELNSSLATGNAVSYRWFFQPTGSSILPLTTTAVPTIFINSAQPANTGIYSVAVSVDGCLSDTSNLEPLTVLSSSLSISATNPTSASDPACKGEDVSLAVPIVPGATYNWYGPQGFHSTLPNPVVPDVGEENEGSYLVLVNEPQCGVTLQASTVLFVSPAPATPILTTNSPVCEGSDLTLSVANPAGTGISYEYFFQPTMTLLDSTSDATLTLSGVSAGYAGQYFAVAINSDGCISPPSSLVQVQVNEQPANVAQAGSDLTLCQLTEEISLNATAPSAGTGVWTSPTGATLVNPDQANTLAINLLEGENLFVWTLSQGSCQNFSSDTVAILVVDAPAEIAFAGGDQSVCGQTQIQLSANVPAAATGTWQQPPNQAAVGVTILDPASPTTAVSGLMPGQNYVFTWALSYQNCPGFSMDEVLVQIAEAPANQAFIAEKELFICDEELAILTASPPAQGSGTWTSLTGATIAEPTSPTTAATDLQLGENVFVWSLSAGGCSNYSSDTLTIRNEALEVLPDSWLVAPNQSLDSVSLVANDFLGDLSGWNFTIVSQPQKGTLTEHSDGFISYLPYPNAFGEDELTYLVCSELCPEICDVAKSRFVIDQASVPVDSCFVPNTITPNGDGFNDTFIVPCVTSYPGSRCTIFNRWFDPVFMSEDYQNDWGGTYEGQPVPVGTYFFVIHLNDAEETVLEGYLVVYRE